MLRWHIDRPLVSLDIEATGPNPSTDRIIELGLVCVEPDGAQTEQRWLINPGRPIPADATAVHGIRDEDVADAPRFDTVALAIAEALHGADLVGFNLRAFDVPLLRLEFERTGLDWPCEGARIIDVFALYRTRETRTLSDAVRFYLGRDHAGAHGAVPDAKATLEVLRAQLARYADLPSDVQALDVVTGGRRPDWATECGRLRFDAAGAVTVAFGKLSGTRLADCDRSWLRWVLSKDFPGDVQDLVRAELHGSSEAA